MVSGSDCDMGSCIALLTACCAHFGGPWRCQIESTCLAHSYVLWLVHCVLCLVWIE